MQQTHFRHPNSSLRLKDIDSSRTDRPPLFDIPTTRLATSHPIRVYPIAVAQAKAVGNYRLVDGSYAQAHSDFQTI